jgi:hypothetical protein
MKTETAPELLATAANARRLLLMVAELHKLGYEGLRASLSCPRPVAIGAAASFRPA